MGKIVEHVQKMAILENYSLKMSFQIIIIINTVLVAQLGKQTKDRDDCRSQNISSIMINVPFKETTNKQWIHVTIVLFCSFNFASREMR